MKFTLALLFLLCTPYAVHCIQVKSGSDLQGTGEQKAQMLAEEISGPGITILDAVFELCDDDQIGFFTDASTELGMGFVNGIVLSSGFATDVVGGNDNTYVGDVLNHKGFAPLDSLLEPTGGATKDACTLHITFECQDHEHFGLKFVFGSDNYDCPAHSPYYSPYEDVMGIFVGSNLNSLSNIGLYSGKYISVDTFTKGSAPKNYVDNCLGSIDIEMNGYSNPITIDNSLDKIVTGKNELWISVADGYDVSPPNDATDFKKPSFLFVRRNSLVCIDPTTTTTKPTTPTTPPKTPKNLKTAFRRCAVDALNSCGFATHPNAACDDWSCLDHHIQRECFHPGDTQTDHHNYKHSVHHSIKRICGRTRGEQEK